MLASTILLVVVRVIDLTSVNLIDILMPPVLLVSVLGGLHRTARADLEAGPAHERLLLAERGLTRWVIAFYALAALSLIRLATLEGLGPALNSSLYLIRAIEGIMFYPLCIWWLRTTARIEHAWRALVVAGTVLAVVNIIGFLAWEVKRAGMTFFLNNWDAPLSTPNEAGTASLIVAVVLIIRQAMRPSWKNMVLGVLMVGLLGLTQSRSGILAWITFGLLTLRWVRPARLLSIALGIAVLVPLLPETLWIRMSRSIMVERNSFEAYSLFARVFGWRAAWGVVQDHPWMGVGYLGFRFVSDAYNQFGLVIGTVENYYYEVLVSMGVIGLAVLAVVLVLLYRLGREVGRIAPPGSLAHHMSRYHAPLISGLLVANLTVDNFMGMVGLAQVAIWTAVLVRSGHTCLAESAQA
jgi:O-antigen ligase